MHDIYWMCLIGGAIFAVVTIIFTDIIGNLIDGIFVSAHAHVFDPLVIVGGITVFGGTGVLLSDYTSLGTLAILLLSLLVAVFTSMLVFLFYIKPMKNAESSTGFSLRDLVGKIGEVTVPLPVQGYGEVMIRIGGGNTNQIAASLDKAEIRAGTRVVIVDVKDNTLYVSRFENNLE